MLRLAVRVRREHAELVLAELLELAQDGVEEVDLDEAMVEYAVYGAPGELPSLPDLRAAAGGALVDLSTREIPDDWPQRWREFHRPLVLGSALTVRPPWEPPSDSEIDVVIDPGQAFGTGAHATTRLCLELMLGMPAHGPFLDVGCGSGVLAITAAKLGFAPVYAIDHDRAAIDATRANARANRVTLKAGRHDLRRRPLQAAQTAAANLLTPLLLLWAQTLHEPPEQLILSGILSTEIASVVDAFALRGLAVRRQLEADDWSALLLGQQ